MLTLNEIENDLKIEYPCDWEYKIFLEHSEDPKEFLASINLAAKSLKKSKQNAKYTCYNALFNVASDHERLELFSLLKKHAKFVI